MRSWITPLIFGWILSLAVAITTITTVNFSAHLADRGFTTAIADGRATVTEVVSGSAAKHAVVGFTESAHLELTAAGSPIKVALVCPGAVATEIARPPAAAAAPARPPDEAAHDPRVEEFRSTFEVVIENGMSADEHARLVFDELSRGAFWIISDPTYLPLMEERLRSIKERRAPLLPGFG